MYSTLQSSHGKTGKQAIITVKTGTEIILREDLNMVPGTWKALNVCKSLISLLFLFFPKRTVNIGF